MSEWKEYKLAEVAEVTSSKRIFYSEYVNQGIPFYRSKEVIDLFNRRNIQTELFISENRFEEIKSKFGVPESDDILLTSVGSIGIPYKVKKGDKFYFKDGNLTWFRKIKHKILFPNFLFQWIVSRVGQQKFEEVSIGSTQIALTISGLKDIEILLPPLREQKAIASVLGSLDDKIDLLHRQNTTLEQMAETLFRQWFIEEAKEEWEVGKLGEEFEIGIGRTPPRKESWWFSEIPIGLKWVSIKDMGDKNVYQNNVSEYLTNEAIDKFNIPIIPENTVLLSFKMTIGRIAITTEKMLSNEAIAHFTTKNQSKLFTEFLYLYLKSYKWEQMGSTSSIVESINSQMIKNLEVILPDEELLLNFKNIIGVYFQKIKSNQIQIQTLSTLRDNLLPKLMSGEVRVRE